jgi:hypothetical protein
MISKKVSELRPGVENRLVAPGPEYFGLLKPVVCYLIQQMEGADQCTNYVMKQFAPAPPKAEAKPKEKEEAPPLPIPRIPRDEDGKPIFPIRLSNTVWITDLGHIVSDRVNFHTERFIYPVGFKSSRPYFSTFDPPQKVRYTSEIVDTGAELPVFRVTMDGHPEVSFEGPTLSSPWNALTRKIFELRGEAGGRVATVTGAQYFGLHHPAIRYLIQQMEGADKCVNYVMTRFASPTVLAKQKHKHRYIAVAQAADEEQQAKRKWKKTVAKEARERAKRLQNDLPERTTLGNWTAEEEEILLRLHKRKRKDWAMVITHLPGRTISGASGQWKKIQNEIRKEAEYDNDEDAPT